MSFNKGQAWLPRCKNAESQTGGLLVIKVLCSCPLSFSHKPALKEQVLRHGCFSAKIKSHRQGLLTVLYELERNVNKDPCVCLPRLLNGTCEHAMQSACLKDVLAA